MSNPAKPGAVATRWWWVRHAPVRNDGGNIYGQEDISCDTSDREVFEAVAKILPRNAVWYASNLMRTHQTAEAIWAAGFPKPARLVQEPAFAEQNLGQWQGLNRAEFIASRPIAVRERSTTSGLARRSVTSGPSTGGGGSTGASGRPSFKSSPLLSRLPPYWNTCTSAGTP